MRWGGAMVVAMLGSVASGAQAQTPVAPAPSPLVTELERCRQIQDPAKRVACYDAASGALVGATRSGQVSVVNREDVRRARRSLFGFSMPKLPWFSGDTSAEADSDLFHSTIRSVAELNGRWRLVLVDNAVWETTENKLNYVAPRPGQKVTIIRGPLGSYFIKIDGQVGLRGRRLS